MISNYLFRVKKKKPKILNFLPKKKKHPYHPPFEWN